MQERLQKVMAARGIASRRAAEQLIAAGVVTVNGRVARIGDTVDAARDAIAVDGAPLLAEPPLVYIALHKPVGYVTSLRSTHGEALVTDLVRVPERLLPVGRLDKDTSGLLLMTNDGEWLNSITHPRNQIEREYRALITGIPTARALQALRNGVQLPDGSTTSPARVEILERRGGRSVLSVVVMEGKKRQVRLMMQAVGHRVLTLQRTRVGPLRLEALRPGDWRHLTPEEVSALGAAAAGSASAGSSRARPAYRD